VVPCRFVPLEVVVVELSVFSLLLFAHSHCEIFYGQSPTVSQPRGRVNEENQKASIVYVNVDHAALS
jgi:hypothetical protein